MKKIAFAGSFDLVTKGHLWVVKEGLNIADSVVMMIAHNSKKTSFLSEAEKVKTVKDSLEELGIADRVHVVVVKKEFTALAALNNGCDYMIRGIRSALDFDDESLIQKANKEVIGGAKTIFVMPPRELESVSSSFVKSLMVAPGWHWVVKEFVTKTVHQFLLRKYVTQQCEKYWTECGLPKEYANQFAQEILTHYESSSRAYHSIEHLAHGFQELEWAQANLENETEYNFSKVGLAFCAHDVIYGSAGGQDEVKSVAWLRECVAKTGAEFDAELEDIILSTMYFEEGVRSFTANQMLIRSVDLCILGQAEKVYDWYSSAVRQEYSFVPDRVFNQKRSEALRTLLENEKMFEIPVFEYKYGVIAKKNLSRELKILEALTETDN